MKIMMTSNNIKKRGKSWQETEEKDYAKKKKGLGIFVYEPS
jgi:hypothetical protein